MGALEASPQPSASFQVVEFDACPYCETRAANGQNSLQNHWINCDERKGGFLTYATRNQNEKVEPEDKPELHWRSFLIGKFQQPGVFQKLLRRARAPLDKQKGQYSKGRTHASFSRSTERSNATANHYFLEFHFIEILACD